MRHLGTSERDRVSRLLPVLHHVDLRTGQGDRERCEREQEDGGREPAAPRARPVRHGGEHVDVRERQRVPRRPPLREQVGGGRQRHDEQGE